MKKLLTIIFLFLFCVPVFAQNINLTNSSSVDEFIATNFNFKININSTAPAIKCFETSTTAASTNCTNIPGGNGMQGICSEPGCYDRAKFELNIMGNASSTKYAVQIANDSSFTNNVRYISGANRFPKSNLTLNDFLYQCEWEGETFNEYCATPNITFQKYNIFGLTPNTLYYLRAVALKDVLRDGSFTYTEWGASATAATQNSSVTFDINIGSDIKIQSYPPYTIKNLNNNYIVFNVSTNALNGIQVFINANNKFELQNVTTLNSQKYTDYLGAIRTVDFLALDGNSFAGLFSSNSLPVSNGVSAYKLTDNSTFNQTLKTNKTLTVIPFGIY